MPLLNPAALQSRTAPLGAACKASLLLPNRAKLLLLTGFLFFPVQFLNQIVSEQQPWAASQRGIVAL